MKKKKQTLIQSLTRTWKNNHGGLLLGMGVVAAVIMSLVWYFNVLPDVELVPESNIGNPLQPTSQSPLIVVISGEPSESVERPTPGYVLLLDQAGKLTENLESSGTLPFFIDEKGLGSVAIRRPQFINFAVIAFLDSNQNGRLDFKNGVPTEPVRTPLSPRTQPKSYDLAEIALTLNKNAPDVLQFDFLSIDGE